jgi:hypothetical protein
MLTVSEFRRIALGLEGAIESAHMGHPDFRINGRIFATLHADRAWGMVKLTPGQQQRFVSEDRVAFLPENGAWGRQGCTAVKLNSVDKEALGEAMTLAWRNAATTNARAGTKAARNRRSTRPLRQR